MSDDGELHSNAAKRAGEEAKREFDAMHGVKEKEGDVAVREINVDHLIESRPAKSTSRDDLGLGYPIVSSFFLSSLANLDECNIPWGNWLWMNRSMTR